MSARVTRLRAPLTVAAAAAAASVGTLGAMAPAGAQATVPASGSPAAPAITVSSPAAGSSYERRSLTRAHFHCSPGAGGSPIVSCTGSVANGHVINTRSVGRKTFTVTAVDASGNHVEKTVHYKVWAYVNPLRAVHGLQRGRIDMGVDYAGSGAILALGKARITMASDNDSGPLSCWGRSCWPGGGIVVYRLLDGPFAGKYVYDAENITVKVKAGQTVRAGHQIAVVHPGFPNMETGWASGHGAETLAISRGHQCSCSDPGGWSSVEGRDFNSLLTVLGAPSGYLQASAPNQQMPAHWPKRCSKASPGLCGGGRPASEPRPLLPLPEGWTTRPS